MKETIFMVSSHQKIREELPELEGKPILSSKYEKPNRKEAIYQAQVHCCFTYA